MRVADSAGDLLSQRALESPGTGDPADAASITREQARIGRIAPAIRKG